MGNTKCVSIWKYAIHTSTLFSLDIQGDSAPCINRYASRWSVPRWIEKPKEVALCNAQVASLKSWKSVKCALVSVQEAAISSRTYEQHHFPGPALVSCKCLMCTYRPGKWCFSYVLLELAASCMHGYKNGLFDGFSGFFNWLSERSTGPLLWDFRFILGGSIDWHTYWRMVLNHPVYAFLNGACPHASFSW